jgi:prohibitin 2
MKHNPAFAELRTIDAARDVAHTLSNSRNRIFLSSESLLVNMSANFNINESQK